MLSIRRLTVYFPILFAFTATLACFGQKGKPNRQDVICERFKKTAEEVQPIVASLTGIPAGKPLEVVMLTRAELQHFLKSTVELEYPEHMLIKQGRSLAELGLLPKGYDLESGLLGMLHEQIGGMYDPRAKILKGMSDLPPGATTSATMNMTISHEMTHALQDRVMDMVSHMNAALKDQDYEYSFRSVIEGMAGIVMLAAAQKLTLDGVPDMEAFWMSQFDQILKENPTGALAAAPPYLQKLLISPYAEGGAFIQAWIRANPGKKLETLLRSVPVSSEQILHFEKYAAGDTPEALDLSGVGKAVPENWVPYYANSLGEFDLRMLFESREATRNDAVETAAGWDGLRYQAYETGPDTLVLVASSAWDSEKDAEEFSQGLDALLSKTREEGDFALLRRGARVHFIIGRNSRGDQGHALYVDILRKMT